MTDASLPLAREPESPGLAKAALLAGFVAAIAELVPVLMVQTLLLQVPAMRVFQAIASGLLGRAAYAGGADTAALGALLHLGISIGAAYIFVLAALRYRPLIDRPFLAGLGYGVAAWVVMSQIVVPLSAAAFPPASDLGMIATSILIHMLAFGLPIAVVARWQLSRREEFA